MTAGTCCTTTVRVPGRDEPGREGPPSTPRGRRRTPVPAPLAGPTATAGDGQVVCPDGECDPDVWYLVYQRGDRGRNRVHAAAAVYHRLLVSPATWPTDTYSTR
jgi:hypothetical protein